MLFFKYQLTNSCVSSFVLCVSMLLCLVNILSCFISMQLISFIIHLSDFP